MSITKRLKAVGPGAMVAAAFIGPGTVTTASVTGAEFGYALLWTMVFSIVATIVLQEMSADWASSRAKDSVKHSGSGSTIRSSNT